MDSKLFDKDGAFVKNIRAEIPYDDADLRDSMKQFGWNPEFPALVDENGVTLVGHRRMEMAKKLGIEPVIKTLKLGQGDAADAERVKLALISNIGAKPLTAKDRRYIAQHLYGKGDWTMQRIAKALNVSVGTVSGDLETFSTTEKVSRTDRLGRQNTGRPKGKRATTRWVKEGARPKLDEARDIVRPMMAANEAVSPHKLQEETGISHVTFDMAITAERARRDAMEEKAALDSIETFSKTAQQKVEIAIRAYRNKLQSEFEAAVRAKVDAELERLVLDYYRKKVDQYEQVINAHKGIMPRATYRLILSCLHPDSRKSASEARLRDAMDAIQSREVVLVRKDAGEKPEASQWPRTAGDWAARKRQVAEERAAKRAAKKNGSAVEKPARP